ncbi:MAG: outer membrane protein assembly factor BamA [Nitrospirota bacterium]|jgi:outer membrane protein insertion porin family
MRKYAGLAGFAVFFAVLLSMLSSDAALGQVAPVVKDIEVRGLRRIEADAVRSHISQKVGAPLSTEAVSRDIKDIYAMGYFDDVRVEVEAFEGGVRLVYVVKEKPSIRRVTIFGNKEIEKSKLSERLTVTPGSLADVVLIQQNADALRAVYEEQGYPLTVVVPVLKRVQEGADTLTFYIIEGPRVKIDDISIEGNKEISGFTLKRAMKTSEYCWLYSWITKGGRYEKTRLHNDLGRIEDVYHNKGFVEAAVSEPKLRLSEDKRQMDITIPVAEGQQFRVSSISFQGNTVFTDAELREKVVSEPGKVVSKKTLSQDVAALTELYGTRGYALAAVFPDLAVHEKERTADVIFRISEGDQYRVGRIEIRGNVKTMDKVIRREIRLKEGEIFNGEKLKRSLQRLKNLNFFEEVKLNPRPHAKTKTLDLEVNVKERATGFLNMGAGYSSVDRLIGTVDFTQANLGGRGQYIKIKAELGSRSDFYEVSFREPWLFDRPVSLDASLYNSNREFTDFDKEATGFSLGLGRSFWEYWHAGALYRIEEATISHIDEDASSLIREQEGTRLTSSISPSILRDTRDNYIDPHEGTRFGVSTDFAGLGGENKFFKVNLEGNVVLPVTRRSALSLKARYGYGTGIFGEKLPLFERYRVGGIYTVRGVRDVGPRDDRGDYIGGLQRLIFNVDYVFPLLSSFGLKGGVFFDAGTAYDSKIDFRYSTGAGIRWISPIGPLRLEYAVNLDRRAGEDSAKWEFAIGTFF